MGHVAIPSIWCPCNCIGACTCPRTRPCVCIHTTGESKRPRNGHVSHPTIPLFCARTTSCTQRSPVPTVVGTPLAFESQWLSVPECLTRLLRSTGPDVGLDRSIASGTRPERKGAPPSPVDDCLLRLAPPGPSREPCASCGGGCDGRSVRSQRKEVVYLQHCWSWV